MASSFDISKAREHFPALNDKQMYFDNAGGSQTLQTVIDSCVESLHNDSIQQDSDIGTASPTISKPTTSN